MSEKKPVSLAGRIALQLKMITKDQLQVAVFEQSKRDDEVRLEVLMVELGYINPDQVKKLQAVQKQVLEKHREKQSAEQAQSTEPSPAVEAAPQAQEAAQVAEPTAIPSPAPIKSRSIPPRPTDDGSSRSRPITIESEASDSLELELPEPSDAGWERLAHQLGSAVDQGASDVHIHAGAPPRVRIHGKFVNASETPTSREDAMAMISSALTEAQRDELRKEGELDICLDVPGVGRFRANTYCQQRGIDVVFRSVSAKPPTLEELGLPPELANYTNYHQGMVLLTGPAGCGKSATMAALVNLINEEREEHILTVEDPIEIVHPSKKCLVNQRHAGRDSKSFARALRGALREDPDIIVIGELRDLETISLAMTAAETGHFVLATLHTNNASRTINRMIGAFPSNQQGQVRTMLSESLRAVITQRLVPTLEGTRVPALEILVITKAIANLVRDEKTVQIRSAIQTGRAQGMCLLEQSLNDLVEQQMISREVALSLAEEEKLITASGA